MSRPMFFSIKITLSNNLKGTYELGNLSLKTLDHCDWVYKLSTIHKKNIHGNSIYKTEQCTLQSNDIQKKHL